MEQSLLERTGKSLDHWLEVVAASQKIKHGEIPEYYFPQVQLNMFILDLEVTDFIEYIPSMIGKTPN